MLKISLKAARINAGLTQEDVARYMHKGKQTIGAWETGKSTMDAANFRELCRLYKIDEDNIFLPHKSNLKSDLPAK